MNGNEAIQQPAPPQLADEKLKQVMNTLDSAMVAALKQTYQLGMEATKEIAVNQLHKNYSSLVWSVCRLYDVELITSSRACELLDCKESVFQSLYAAFPHGSPYRGL